MRIAIDARKINDFGIGTYLRNLIRLLPTVDSDNTYHLLCYRSDEALLRTLSERFELNFIKSANYSVSEHLTIPLQLRRIGANLYHAPHYVLPYWLTVRSVVTIHDVIHLLFPQYLPSRLAERYARQMIGRAVSKARTIMTVSNTSKRDLRAFFDVESDKIRVIPNGIDPAMTTPMDPTELARIKARLQLDGRSILFVGNIKPHKNVERLIEAFARLRQDESLADVKLIVVGDELSKYPALRRAVARHRIRKHVRFFGFVPEMTLVGLYQSADVFALPSLYEGFGLPVLEAMANGTPVVTSNLSSLPEVVGKAALTVDPYDVGAIADAIRRVLVEEDLRNRLIRDGRERAKDFSWETSVRQIHQTYLDALQ